jgi:hypothetical protein
MESHLLSRVTRFSGRCVSRSAPFVAVIVLAAQVIAQNPLIPSSVKEPSSASGSQQIDAANPTPPTTEISAPAPAEEQASLSNAQRIPFLAIAAGQDTSQSSSPSAAITTTTQTPTQKKKPAHRGLGIALVVVGTTALVVGAVGYAVFTGPGTFCNGGGDSGNCHTANTAALVLIPVGAGVAGTGLYFTFHR